MPLLTGEWADHPDANFSGYTDLYATCPRFAQEFSCKHPGGSGTPNPELWARESRQVFQPDQCELREWDPAGFERCMAGRRLLMFGDSLMRQVRNSRSSVPGALPGAGDAFTSLGPCHASEGTPST